MPESRMYLKVVYTCGELKLFNYHEQKTWWDDKILELRPYLSTILLSVIQDNAALGEL